VLGSLHPRLRMYFGEIPAGKVGVGVGVFDVVGTRRLWLWPALALLGRAGILFPAWRHGVPFTVLNYPVMDFDGNPAVLARRTFRFRRGDRTMTDAITADRRGLLDHLGMARRVSARLAASVIDGDLQLESTSVSVRIGRLSIPIPRAIAPVVHLLERFDDDTQLQQVSLTVDSPQLGRLYEYSGSFTYALVSRGQLR
jgi:hypothetical protein